MKLPVKIIFDSNFLLIQPQFCINIYEELENKLNRKIERIIISPIYEELQKLSKRKKIKERKNALMTLQFIKNFDIIKVERLQNETVDDLIIRLAKKWNSPVATNDKELRRKLRNMSIAVIYLRQKSHLEVEGMIK
ncbi:30S processome protein Utp24 [Candidatus Bathyarchaeota archaeon]|nr:30S processome protein Utp24 [Candidatus Bathyarchaeota archaeon]